MRIERTKNAVRNIKFGFILKIYQLLTPFLLRTAVIYKLGVQYVGLSSLFGSILSVLSLAELGVGAAMVFSMYKPIAEEDTETICALMSLYKQYYRAIGMVILVVSLILTPFIPNLISGDVPNDINIYVLFLINVASTVLSYWLFAYKSCLFTAHQRGDISSKISLVISTLTYILQAIALFIWGNYYLYLAVGVLTQILQNVIASKLADQLYPNYQAKGNVSFEIRKKINQRVRDLFTAKVGGVIFNSTDTIVISAFLGVTILGVYNNYFYIMSSIVGFLDIIYYGCLAGIGNSLVTETKEKNYQDFEIFTFLISYIATIATTCFLNLYQPFMKIWMSNNENMLLDMGIVICLCIYFFVGQINRVVNMYKDAAGIWHIDRFRPLVAGITNLCLNLVMVRYIGLFGIILSTVIATILVDCPWLVVKLFNTVFEKKNRKKYIKDIFIYAIVAVLVSSVTFFCCNLVKDGGIFELFIKLIICVSISNVIMLCVYRKRREFIQVRERILKTLKERMNKSK